MDREQETLIDIFSEERDRRDAEEDSLRNRSKVGKFSFLLPLAFIFDSSFLCFYCCFLNQFLIRDLVVVGSIYYHPRVT